MGLGEGLPGGPLPGGPGGAGWAAGTVFETKLFLILIAFLCKLQAPQYFCLQTVLDRNGSAERTFPEPVSTDTVALSWLGEHNERTVNMALEITCLLQVLTENAVVNIMIVTAFGRLINN